MTYDEWLKANHSEEYFIMLVMDVAGISDVHRTKPSRVVEYEEYIKKEKLKGKL